MAKSPEMVNFLDSLTSSWFARKASECIRLEICVTCGGPATEFRNEKSQKEYSISGMCQACQDEIFEN